MYLSSTFPTQKLLEDFHANERSNSRRGDVEENKSNSGGGGGYRNRYGWKKKKKKGIIGRREDIASSECRSRLAHQNKTWILHVAGPVSPRISYIYICVYLHTYKCTIVDRRTVERGYSSEHDRGKKASRKKRGQNARQLVNFSLCIAADR